MNISGWFTLVSVIGFIIYCFLAEANCSAKHTPAVVTILCRLVARHMKVAWRLFFGVVYFIVAVAAFVGMSQPVRSGGSGGRETELIAGLFNRLTYFPQLVIEGFLLFAQIFTIALLFGLVGIKDSVAAHLSFCVVAAIVIYLVWLAITVCGLVEEEFVSSWIYTTSQDHDGEVAHRVLTKKDRIMWSVLTLVLWLVALGATGTWLSGHLTSAPSTTQVFPPESFSDTHRGRRGMQPATDRLDSLA